MQIDDSNPSTDRISQDEGDVISVWRHRRIGNELPWYLENLRSAAFYSIDK